MIAQLQGVIIRMDLGLMVCQNAAFGQDADLPLAPMPAGFEVALAPPVATAPAVPSVTATVPGAACEEGCGSAADAAAIVTGS